MDHPESGSGFLHWAMLGFFSGLTILLIAQLFPGLIPARATAYKL